MKQAKKMLHITITQHLNDPHIHKAYIDIMCNYIILGTEALRTTKSHDLKKHNKRLGVDAYQTFHDYSSLSHLTVDQYYVPEFLYMLLSHRSRKIGKGWVT